MNIDRKEIIEILSKVLDIEVELASKIDDEEVLESYGLDSLSMMKIIVLLEEKFQIEFNFEYLVIEKVNTIKNIVQTLKQLQEVN